jgi:hypothetical protein
MRENLSPRIEKLTWGRIEIEGNRKFKDAKLFPGGAREWDWRETGTRHVPGIQPADIQELLDHQASIVVLSKGMWQRLHVCPETLEKLRQKKIDVRVLQTEEAVKLYNDLAASQPVGALIHSTC